MSDYQEVDEACRFLSGRLERAPEAAVVLGSGLDALSGALAGAINVSYEQIPHWPRSTVAGHSGRLVAGSLGDKYVLVLAGRAHLYEGHSPASVVFPIRVAGALGVRTLVLTNAAGGINPAFRAGQRIHEGTRRFFRLLQGHGQRGRGSRQLRRTDRLYLALIRGGGAGCILDHKSYQVAADQHRRH